MKADARHRAGAATPATDTPLGWVLWCTYHGETTPRLWGGAQTQVFPSPEAADAHARSLTWHRDDRWEARPIQFATPAPAATTDPASAAVLERCGHAVQDAAYREGYAKAHPQSTRAQIRQAEAKADAAWTAFRGAVTQAHAETPAHYAAVTRVEVIDHRAQSGMSKRLASGRVFVAIGCTAEVAVQDAGRTLTVSVTDGPGRVP